MIWKIASLAPGLRRALSVSSLTVCLSVPVQSIPKASVTTAHYSHSHGAPWVAIKIRVKETRFAWTGARTDDGSHLGWEANPGIHWCFHGVQGKEAKCTRKKREVQWLTGEFCEMANLGNAAMSRGETCTKMLAVSRRPGICG
jgi:hypothetical protein